MRIGLISDTHGLLRPEVLAYLAGSAHIIHAGDICAPAILEALAQIAPVTAVRGNNDRGAWAEALPPVADLVLGSCRIRVIHDLAELPPVRGEGRVDVVISGHSHLPKVQARGGVLYVNPGSAGRRRFQLPIAAGELWIDEGGCQPAIQLFEV